MNNLSVHCITQYFCTIGLIYIRFCPIVLSLHHESLTIITASCVSDFPLRYKLLQMTHKLLLLLIIDFYEHDKLLTWPNQQSIRERCGKIVFILLLSVYFTQTQKNNSKIIVKIVLTLCEIRLCRIVWKHRSFSDAFLLRTRTLPVNYLAALWYAKLFTISWFSKPICLHTIPAPKTSFNEIVTWWRRDLTSILIDWNITRPKAKVMH